MSDELDTSGNTSQRNSAFKIQRSCRRSLREQQGDHEVGLGWLSSEAGRPQPEGPVYPADRLLGTGGISGTKSRQKSRQMAQFLTTEQQLSSGSFSPKFFHKKTLQLVKKYVIT
jgi:hypothetical protein